MRRVVTVTLNPALDVATAHDAVEPGPKLRCDPVRLDPGGGGVNVSRAIAKMGRSSRAFVAIGGPTGQSYRTLLEDEGQSATWFEVPGNTRQSLGVFDRSIDRQFRFVMPGPEWSARMMTSCKAAMLQELRRGDLLVFSGSFPPGVSVLFMQDLCTQLSAEGVDVLLDLSGEALQSAARATDRTVHVLRMDQREAGEILGTVTPNAAEAEALARSLVAQGAARLICIALGAEGGIVASESETWRAIPPKVNVVSATGAGDSFVAGFTIGLAEGWSLEDCTRYATAAATSAVSTDATELCHLEGVQNALPGVTTIAL